MTRVVEEALVHYGEITRAAAASYLEDAGEAAGLRDLVADYPSRGGKAIRPALCLATCVAFGGTLDDALPTAVAIELLHNAFLVHDDVEDGSLLRRGAPTLNARYGEAVAVNVGDALALLAMAPLRDNRRTLSARMAALIAEEFDTMARRTVEGQATELSWRRGNRVDLTPDDYLDLVLRKTCWYTTIHPLRAGAVIGSWGHAPLDDLVRFGFHLGAAFQIADDLLNLTGDVERYGKEALGDLFEGKRTLMVIHLLAVLPPPERSDLVQLLALERSQRTDADVRGVLGLMVQWGSLEFARAFGRGIAEAAHSWYGQAFGHLPPTPESGFVRDLITFMLDRDA